MNSNVERRIRKERELVTALDCTLDAKRTPYLKGQLRRAADVLDDAVEALRFAEIAESNYVASWTGLAEMNIQVSEQLRQKVKAVVDMYGGPDQVIEIGG